MSFHDNLTHHCYNQARLYTYVYVQIDTEIHTYIRGLSVEYAMDPGSCFSDYR